NFSRQTAEDGEVTLKINKKEAGKLSYTKGQRDGLQLTRLEANLEKEGVQLVQIDYSAKVKNPLPYTFAVNYATYLPPSDEQCKVRLKTELTTQKVQMGETARLKISLTNKTQEGLPMTIAIVGIPAGLSVQPWQLKQLQEKQVFDFYEIIGNRIAFYYRQMKPAENREINLDLKADIPGTYEGMASCAYLYYTNEFKHWVEGLSIEIEK
ncbi:MAG: hypothetical protein RMJ89_10570, partial [Flammeovirgaceae bacterium]|nr:hypothetical protein [Flammeovirgaceae bacterium]